MILGFWKEKLSRNLLRDAWVLAPRLVQRQIEQQYDLIMFLKKKVPLKNKKD